ncbi:hypothetical protein D3C71_1079400 [compost metagenome]
MNIRRSISILAMLTLGISGCVSWPSIEIRNSTYDETPVSKFARSVWSFGDDFASQETVSWFEKKCPYRIDKDARVCAEQLGMTCLDIPSLSCTYSAQEDSRRIDRYSTPEAREWRTIKFTISISGDAHGGHLTAFSRYGDY